MRRFRALLTIELLFVKRELSAFVMGIGMPSAFFVFFASMIDTGDAVSQQRFLTSYLMSMAAFSSISFSLFVLPLMLVEDRRNSWALIVRQSPVPMRDYYLAKVCRMMVQYLLAISIVFMVGHFVKGVNLTATQWVVSGLLLIVGNLGFIGIGLLVSQLQSLEKISVVSNVLYLGLAMLGGLWFPVHVFPQWMQQLAKLTPTYHLHHLVTHYVFDKQFNIPSIVVLMTYGVMCFGVALWYQHRREGVKM